METRKHDRIVSFGDSITEWGRDKSSPDSLGHGHVSIMTADLLDCSPRLGLHFYNRGVSGDKVQDLLNHMDDRLSCQPDAVILVVGINDVWRLVGRDDFASQEEQQRFENVYRQLLQALKQAGIEHTSSVEPFMLDYPEDRMEWRRDLDPKIQIVCYLARELKLELVPLDGLMNEQTSLYGRCELTGDDGVHPASISANIIAQEILGRLTFIYRK